MTIKKFALPAEFTSDDPSTDFYFTEQEAAALLKISCRTLQRWRQEGLGLPFRRFGGLVRYARSDIHSWALKQARTSTSEAI